MSLLENVSVLLHMSKNRNHQVQKLIMNTLDIEFFLKQVEL